MRKKVKWLSRKSKFARWKAAGRKARIKVRSYFYPVKPA